MSQWVQLTFPLPIFPPSAPAFLLLLPPLGAGVAEEEVPMPGVLGRGR